MITIQIYIPDEKKSLNILKCVAYVFYFHSLAPASLGLQQIVNYPCMFSHHVLGDDSAVSDIRERGREGGRERERERERALERGLLGDAPAVVVYRLLTSR